MNDTEVLRGGVLVLNAGSSSLKFAIHEPTAPFAPRSRGQIDRLGRDGSTISWTRGGAATSREPFAIDRSRAPAAFLQWLSQRIDLASLTAVGHRVVHGGPRFDRPTRVDAELLAELGRIAPFDPEHLPFEIALIETLREQAPAVPQVACFDTAFHRNLPDVAKRLPLPRTFHDQGVRRYGFHGLSFAYLMDQLSTSTTESVPRRVVLAHLGNGSSLAAVRDGQCIDTTMGFSPAGGIPMSTRTGDLDPGVLQFLLATRQLAPEAIGDLVTRRSGLLGVSGISGDMRDLLSREATDPNCQQAVNLYCYAVRKQIGAYAAALGGLDALAFTGGVGEHAAPVRRRICAELEFLGIALDDRKNAQNEAIISSAMMPVVVRVIPTNEELMIVRDTLATIGDASGSHAGNAS